MIESSAVRDVKSESLQDIIAEMTSGRENGLPSSPFAPADRKDLFTEFISKQHNIASFRAPRPMHHGTGLSVAITTMSLSPATAFTGLEFGDHPRAGSISWARPRTERS